MRDYVEFYNSPDLDHELVKELKKKPTFVNFIDDIAPAIYRKVAADYDTFESKLRKHSEQRDSPLFDEKLPVCAACFILVREIKSASRVVAKRLKKKLTTLVIARFIAAGRIVKESGIRPLTSDDLDTLKYSLRNMEDILHQCVVMPSPLMEDEFINEIESFRERMQPYLEALPKSPSKKDMPARAVGKEGGDAALIAKQLWDLNIREEWGLTKINAIRLLEFIDPNIQIPNDLKRLPNQNTSDNSDDYKWLNNHIK
jgi:hypothetical protein